MTSAPDIVAVILRAAALVLMFQSAGLAIFVGWFGSQLKASLLEIQQLGTNVTLAAAVALAARYSLEASRMSGEFSGALDPSLQSLVLHSSTGGAFILHAAGMALAGVSFRTPGARLRVFLGVAGALVGAVAFADTGHTSVHAHRPVLALLLVCHVFIGMLWFGALWPLCLITMRETPAIAGAIIQAFSAYAVWLVPLILVAGIGMTAILVPGLATFSQPYGQLLIAKVGLFVVLMGLAAANRRRFGPAVASGAGGAGFRSVVAAEFVLICAVLVVTACLTTFFSPDA